MVTAKLPEALAACWDGDPEVTRTEGGGWRAELEILGPTDRPRRILKIAPGELRILRELVDGDPVTHELARAILRQAQDEAGGADPSTGSG